MGRRRSASLGLELSARMDWTVKPHAEANHNPGVTVNGVAGTDVITLTPWSGSR